jgi:uncharacterized protein (DUF2164 family)
MRRHQSLTISDDARKHAAALLRECFDANTDEEIGDLQAGLLVDFVVSEIGPTIYNQAVADARAFFEERASDLSGACYYNEFPTALKRKRE